MHTNTRSHWYTVFILLVLVLFVTACRAPTETPTVQPEIPAGLTEVPVAPIAPTEMPEPVPGYALPDFPTPENPCEPDYSPITSTIDLEDNGLVYVPHQIILTGSKDDITSFFNVFPGIFPGIFTEGPLNPFDGLPTGDIYVRLYSIGSGQSVWTVMDEINAYASSNQLFVFAEPNYLVGLGPGGGSGINGAPADSGYTVAEEYAKAEFLNQWAFTGGSSIHLFDDSQPKHQWSPGGITGANVAVAVFDTTPLISGSHTIDWAVQPFNLCVWQPGLMFGNSGAPSTGVIGDPIPPGEHGLFATGLAHGVAPAAQYTLIEVLNSKAHGDVHTLLYAMRQYAKSRDDDLTNTVMNLSLGLEIDRQPELIEDNDAIRNSISMLKGNIDSYLKYLADNNLQVPYYLSLDYLSGQFAQEFPVVALGTSLAIYRELGAVIVAAAGNEGSDTPNAPARFDDVIGVAASNVGRENACFSNRGDLAAPGGDAQDHASCPLNAGNACPADQVGCEYTLTSLVSQNASVSGYATWQGTSFAAPQVSGLAALLLEANPGLGSADVRNIIEAGLCPGGQNSPNIDRLGAGIINVEKTFSNIPCP